MFKYVTTLFMLACVSALDLELAFDYTGTCLAYAKGTTERINCCNSLKSWKIPECKEQDNKK